MLGTHLRTNDPMVFIKMKPLFGLGLRAEHYTEILDQAPRLDYFEIISEDFLVSGGSPLYYLDKIRANYPLVMHGVSLSIGSSDELNWDYLKELKNLAQRVQPLWISDHLCWTGVQNINTHDLLPLPYTEISIQHVVERVKRVQEFLGQQILLENVSSYVSYAASQMSELEFLVEVAERADCLILLDINNVYVSAFNHHFSAEHYLSAVPVERVRQFHLAGHKRHEHYIVDTHDAQIIPEVWDLYHYAVQRFGNVATSIERDDHIPPLSELMQELEQARRVATKAIATKKSAQTKLYAYD